MRLQAPAHHLTAVQIQDYGQVQPALVGGDVGDVAAPQRIGSLRRKASLHQIGGNRQMMFAVGGHHKFALGAGAYAVLLHQPAHPLLAHTHAPCEQFFVHAWPAVFALELGVYGTDVHKQGLLA